MSCAESRAYGDSVVLGLDTLSREHVDTEPFLPTSLGWCGCVRHPSGMEVDKRQKITKPVLRVEHAPEAFMIEIFEIGSEYTCGMSLQVP